MIDTSEVLARIVSADLRGSEEQHLPAAPDPTDFEVLLTAAAGARVLGLLARAVADGSVPMTREQASRCADAASAAIVDDLERERRAVWVTTLFSDAGVDSRVLKGPASAHLDEDDPTLRSFGDIDLLVPGDAFDEAVALLSAHGWQRRFPQPRPGFDARFGKGVAMYKDDEEIDLHRTLAPGPYGFRIPPADLWERAETFDLGGTTMRALPPDLRLLHAGYHAVLGGSSPRLSSLRDLVHLSRRVDAHRAVLVARRWRGEAVLDRAVALTSEHLGVPMPSLMDALASVRPTARDERLLAAYRGGRDRYARQAIATIGAIEGWRDRRDYIRSLVLPDASYVEGRHGSARARWRVAYRALRRRR